MNDNDDKILLLALQKGEEKAFDMIFHKYFDLLYNFISKNTGSKIDAEELTQDVFIRLWQNRHTPVIYSLRSYLLTIAKNIAIDHIRQSINKSAFESLTDHASVDLLYDPETEHEEEKLLGKIHRLAESMPSKRYEVYTLRWIDGLSRKEIATKMGISLGAVDVHIRKAIEFLKRHCRPPA